MNEYQPKIHVVDAGARFGVHPSWKSAFDDGLVEIYAFEPDSDESDRLERKYATKDQYHVYNLALGAEDDVRGQLNLLSHRGQSSFFLPNGSSDWFRTYRAEDSIIDEVADVRFSRLDTFLANSDCPSPDFIKTDTEGYDFWVLTGSGELLRQFLGVRTEVHFQDTFIGAPSFSDIHQLLNDNGLILANIDYDGRGTPQSYFCPANRWGIITGSEAVYIRRNEDNLELEPLPFLKVLIFCFANNLQDTAVSLMTDYEALPALRLYPNLLSYLEKMFLLACKSLEYLPGDNFSHAKKDYERFFDSQYPEKHLFFQSGFLNP